MYCKSGLMVMGESKNEILQVMDDLESQTLILTIGQYLQPSPKHYPSIDIMLHEFVELKNIALSKGFY